MAKKEIEKDEAVSEGKGLGELIETRRFLGREFLTWLWFESEVFDERFTIEGFGDCELWLERQITLEATTEVGKEKSRLSGHAPSGTPEAREALRQGKLPIQARLGVRRDEQEFALVLDADTLGLSGVKIPALIKGEGEDPFYERISLVEEIERAIESLYRDFVVLRLRDEWARLALPAMRAWIAEDDGPALARYRELRDRRGVSLASLARDTDARPPRQSTTRARVVSKKAKTG